MGQAHGTTMFRSLRLRIALSYGLLLVFILASLGGATYVLLSRSLDHQATASVLAAARETAERVIAGRLTGSIPDTDPPSAAEIQVAVLLPDGSLVGERGEAPPWLRPQRQGTTTIDVLGEPVRIVTLPVRANGARAGTVIAARSLVSQERLLRQARLLLGGGGLMAVLIGMVAGWILAGRAARPVLRAYQAQAGFASDASHELRTPLAFVRSGVEVLATHEPDLGRDVLLEVDYLTGLTDRLLMLARADSGRLELTTGPIDAAALCRRSAIRTSRALGLACEVAAGEAWALGDPVALEAAIDAVLENVARHGGGVAAIRFESKGERTILRVIDWGPGMNPDERTRAFERFFRADPARSRDAGGSGLGLALARVLVEAQGGRLLLEETPGGGLTAVFDLCSYAPAGKPRPKGRLLPTGLRGPTS